MKDELHLLVAEAQGGSKEALERVVSYAQGPIYNLALRMVQLPMDAEDATQEILIKLITHLGQFRGESAFSTWMYRVATNHLLTMRLRSKEAQQLSFDTLSQHLALSLASYDANPEAIYEQSALSEEVRRSCTLGMLICLSREDRLALILGELLELSGTECAYIMELSAAAFRQRLSRARKALVGFVAQQCGVVNPANPCRCHKHVRNKIGLGQLDQAHLHYTQPHDQASLNEVARAQQLDLDDICRTTALLRSHPRYGSRIDFVEMLRDTVAADRRGVAQRPTNL
jgi:RNA polymerase sigma factor (sigma-70 family)